MTVTMIPGMEDVEGFAREVRKARARAGMSLREAARRSHIPYSTISDWEHGRRVRVPDRDTITVLERTYRVTDKRLLAAAGYPVDPADVERRLKQMRELVSEAEQRLAEIRRRLDGQL